MTSPRTVPPLEADERATLTAFLDWQRATLALCGGTVRRGGRSAVQPVPSRHRQAHGRGRARTGSAGLAEPMATIFAPGAGPRPRRVRRSGYVSLRWVLTHMIEEYARHNGHADLSGSG